MKLKKLGLLFTVIASIFMVGCLIYLFYLMYKIVRSPKKISSYGEKIFIIIYSSISIIFVFLGTVLSNDLVWELTDFFNYLMVLPNVIALIALSRLVVDETKEARLRRKQVKIEKKQNKKHS